MIRSAVQMVSVLLDHKPMRYFAYDYFDEDGAPTILVKSEKEILNEYWAQWGRMMETRYNFTPEEAEKLKQDECIEYWVSLNWAWEVDERGRPLEPR